MNNSPDAVHPAQKSHNLDAWFHCIRAYEWNDHNGRFSIEFYFLQLHWVSEIKICELQRKNSSEMLNDCIWMHFLSGSISFSTWFHFCYERNQFHLLTYGTYIHNWFQRHFFHRLTLHFCSKSHNVQLPCTTFTYDYFYAIGIFIFFSLLPSHSHIQPQKHTKQMKNGIFLFATYVVLALDCGSRKS